MAFPVDVESFSTWLSLSAFSSSASLYLPVFICFPSVCLSLYIAFPVGLSLSLSAVLYLPLSAYILVHHYFCLSLSASLYRLSESSSFRLSNLICLYLYNCFHLSNSICLSQASSFSTSLCLLLRYLPFLSTYLYKSLYRPLFISFFLKTFSEMPLCATGTSAPL